MSSPTPTPQAMRAFCRANAHQTVEFGECNATQLAENCAHHFDKDFWLDDSEHAVWEIALDEAERHDRAIHVDTASLI